MVRDNLDFQLRSIKVGLFMKSLYVLLEFYIQDSQYFILNIYVPNKCCEQPYEPCEQPSINYGTT